jgi:hypothetical protein
MKNFKITVYQKRKSNYSGLIDVDFTLFVYEKRMYTKSLI